MKGVVLTSAYLAPVHYYAWLYAADTIWQESCEHYVKQTYRNRCVIAGPSGPIALTLPVEHGCGNRPATRDIRLSEHGNWRHLHWTALCSAYENSPYFEYYADYFRPFYEKRFDYLVDFNEGLRETICHLLDLHPNLITTDCYLDSIPVGVLDLREIIRPKIPYEVDPSFSPVPYYQVFNSKTGFLPNLSMVDLLFNMGPESRLILRDSLRISE